MRQLGLVGLTIFILAVIWAAVLSQPPRTHAQTAATSGFGYVHIAGATAATQVATIGQTLHTLVINTPGSTATLYDNASACTTTTIATLSTTAVGTFTYDLQLKNGLCIVTVGAGTDITLTLR